MSMNWKRGLRTHAEWLGVFILAGCAARASENSRLMTVPELRAVQAADSLRRHVSGDSVVAAPGPKVPERVAAVRVRGSDQSTGSSGGSEKGRSSVGPGTRRPVAPEEIPGRGSSSAVGYPRVGATPGVDGGTRVPTVKSDPDSVGSAGGGIGVQAERSSPPAMPSGAVGEAGVGATMRRDSRVPGVQQGRWIHVEGPQPVVNLTPFQAPLADVVAYIAGRTGANIVLSREDSVQGALVTAEIRNLPWHLALEALLEANGFRPVQAPSGVITIFTEGAVAVNREPVMLDFRYAYAKDLERPIRRIVGGSGADSSASGVEIIGDAQRSRRLMVVASPDDMAKVRRVVAELDRRPKMVTSMVRVVGVNRDEMWRRGLSYGLVPLSSDSVGVLVSATGNSLGSPLGEIAQGARPAFTGLLKLVGRTVGVNVFLDAVLSAGFAETETTPLTTALSDVTSRISVGDAFILPNSQPLILGGVVGYDPNASGSTRSGVAGGGVSGIGNANSAGGIGSAGQAAGVTTGGFSRFDTGTTLEVTSYVLGEDEVRVNINLVRDGGTLSPDGRSITGGTQSVLTEVVVRSGQPIVIGGLMVNARSRTNSGVPGLSKVPGLGHLFKTEGWATKQQELMIVVTPTIVDPERSAATNVNSGER